MIIRSEVSKSNQWLRNGHHIQCEYNSVENSDINFTKWQKKKKKNEMKNKISALFMGGGIKMKCNFMNNLEFNKNFKFISSIKLWQCFN